MTDGRLKNILVEVFETDPRKPGTVGQKCAEIGSTSAPDCEDISLTCDSTLTGRYVKISKQVARWGPNLPWFLRCDALMLCEVKVEASSMLIRL